MGKRFIDTNIFNDDWFAELSTEGKLFFIYFITNCDHAGILKFNPKLFEFQTKLNSYQSLIQELGNSIITVIEGLNIYFMPRFIKYQYPNFPKSSVKQQDSAIKILQVYGLWDSVNQTYVRKKLTVTKQLPNSYDNDNENEDDNVLLYPILLNSVLDENLKKIKNFNLLSDVKKKTIEKLISRIESYSKVDDEILVAKSITFLDEEKYLKNRKGFTEVEDVFYFSPNDLKLYSLLDFVFYLRDDETFIKQMKIQTGYLKTSEVIDWLYWVANHIYVEGSNGNMSSFRKHITNCWRTKPGENFKKEKETKKRPMVY